MTRDRCNPKVLFLCIQVFVAGAFAIAYALMPLASGLNWGKMTGDFSDHKQIGAGRQYPLSVSPLHDDQQLISDDELTAVLKKLLPRFPSKALRPNLVEHALRIWGGDAQFRQDFNAMSGADMVGFLTDHQRFAASWGSDVEPLAAVKRYGLAVHWGRDRAKSASFHHDHWLACLSEAGIDLNHPVKMPSGDGQTVENVLEQALLDFRLDQREVEWSTMVFAFWLTPRAKWSNEAGRQISFNQLAHRLMRGHMRYGSCGGTHRIYSLVVLLRLDEEHQILSSLVKKEIYGYLERVRNLITVAQSKEGYWPYGWNQGLVFSDDSNRQKVIATGHHLEWLALAPAGLHPPQTQIRKAARWLIDDILSRSPEEIFKSYTAYSHAGNSLALWRGVRPWEFWRGVREGSHE